MNVKPIPPASCHPDRPHYGKGLCHSCWRQTRREKDRAAERARYWADPEKGRAKLRAKYRRDPEKAKQRYKRYREANKDKVAASCRRANLKTKGITVEQYDEMLAWQGGGCALCRTTKPGGNGKHFHVDHDHGTGMVRGLLCSPCNTAIGLLRDDSELCRRAAEYLAIKLHPVLSLLDP